MYGIFHRVAREMVTRQVGADGWRRVREASSLGDDGFISGRIYSDETTRVLIAACAEVLQLTYDETFLAFGEFWVEFTSEGHFAEILRMAGDDLPTLLNNIEAMHERMASVLPGAHAASLRVLSQEPALIRLAYRSERRGLEPFVQGLLRGVLTRFGLNGEVRVARRVADGADFAIILEAP